MAPPTNTSFGTATDLGNSYPISVTQQIDDAGTYYAVYYKITITSPIVLGFWMYGDSAFDYIARVSGYYGPSFASQQIDYYQTRDDTVAILWLNVGTYYFYIQPVGPLTLSPANLHISVVEAPDGVPNFGDALIFDDSNDHIPSLCSQIDGTIVTYNNNGSVSFPAGENGTSIPGYVIFVDDSNDIMAIFDYDLNLLNTVDAWPGQSGGQDGASFLATDHSTYVYWGIWDNGAGISEAKKIRVSDGAILATYGPLFASPTPLHPGDADNDNTVLYYADATGSGNLPIKRWDLVNNVALSNLAAGVVDHQNIDICVLNDGTILVLYYDNSATDTFVRQYSAAGAVLNTYNFGDIQHNADSVPRMCAGIDNQSTFWLYCKSEHDALIEILQVQVSDGTILMDTGPTIMSAKNGSVSYGSGQADPGLVNARFGPSPCCPMMLRRGGSSPTSPAGLYVYTDELESISDIRRNDEYFTSDTTTEETAIPDPSATIFPSGD